MPTETLGDIRALCCYTRRLSSRPQQHYLHMLVQKRRNKAAALKLFRKLLKNQGVHPETIVTDSLASYPAAASELGCEDRHRAGRLRDNNRAENSHLPIRLPRTQTAAVQIARFSPEISRHTCRHLQYFQRPTPSHSRRTLGYLRAEAMATWVAATAST